MEAFGWIGFALFQVFYLPQAIKLIRSRDASGLSLPSWLILWLAQLLYLIYSIYQHDLVFTVGNAAGLVQATITLGLMLKFGKKRESPGV